MATLTLKCALADELKRRTLARPPSTLDQLRAAVREARLLDAVGANERRSQRSW